jgi:glycosyltransferase involved in cell wall biosynthesis
VLYGYAKGFKNWLYLVAERTTAPVTDRLVALSGGEMRESIEHGIGRADQWVVIPSGVPSRAPSRSFAAATEAGSGRLRIRIGSVARLEHVKGIDVLVRAAAHLANSRSLRDVRYEILVWGEGEQREELLRLAKDEGVVDVLRFSGTSQPVDEFLASLDVYVQPSRNEGMGRALVLAQSYGLPVVATSVCGIPDVVRDGETGILVESEDPAALAAALEPLVLDFELRARLGAAAAQWISKIDDTGHPHFSVEAMVWRLIHLYQELTAGAA